MKYLRVNVGETGLEWVVVASGQVTFTDAEFDVHGDADNTKIAKFDTDTLIDTVTTRTYKTPNGNGTLMLLELAQTVTETITSSKNGDVLIPNVDTQGNIGSASKRFASVRAVLIQSGDIILTDKKTGKALYIIDEDKEGITFKTFRGKKMMKILRNGNLLVRGKIIEGVKF